MGLDDGEEDGANASARRECNGKKRKRTHDVEDVEEPEPSQATLVSTQEPIPIDPALLVGGILCDALGPALVGSLPLETCVPLHGEEILDLWDWLRRVRFPFTIVLCLRILRFQLFTVRPAALHGWPIPFANMLSIRLRRLPMLFQKKRSRSSSKTTFFGLA